MNNSQLLDYPHVNQSVIPQEISPALALTVDAFVRSLLGKNRSPGTIRAYRSDVVQFLAWLVENNGVLTHPGQVTKADVSAYLASLGQAGLTGVSRIRKLAAIREYFRFLVLHEAIGRSPTEGIIAPRREQRLRTWPRPAEYNQLLSLAGANPRDFAILQVFLQTGVRVSELCHLTLGDIDLAGRMLIVRGGKGMADRAIELEKKTGAALKRWLAVRPRVIDSHLFLNYQGTPLSDRGVRKLVTTYQTAAALSKHTSPHTLRHTFVTAKANQGVPLSQVQAWAGHKSATTTLGYAHVDRLDSHKAMEATSL